MLSHPPTGTAKTRCLSSVPAPSIDTVQASSLLGQTQGTMALKAIRMPVPLPTRLVTALKKRGESSTCHPPLQVSNNKLSLQTDTTLHVPGTKCTKD